MVLVTGEGVEHFDAVAALVSQVEQPSAAHLVERGDGMLEAQDLVFVE